MSWRIGGRSRTCAHSEREFRPGDRVVSTLHAVAAEPGEEEPDDDLGEARPAFVRRDVLEEHAATVEAEDTEPPFSRWIWEVPEPEPRKPVLDLAAAREFLVRLIREDAPERASLRYLLVLMLLRKRLVKLHGEGEDGEALVVEVPPDVPPTEIACPELTPEETDSLREELGRLFDL